ncbi:MAG: ketoacyl-ACP synthase III [Acidobacteriota bacterium]|nr:ketoacyl-ACP synthase III [Blastocatellia bacterium]MDW8240017.1 ketoacyl-ACP synthase III [Acidobacteriota bacterium]
MPYSYANIRARIVATGSHLPSRVITNSEILGLEGSDSSIRRLLGAVERRGVEEHEACSDIITAAATRVLETAEISPLEIDRIIVSTTPGDFVEPCTASVVQYKLRARCAATDVGMSCVGWVAGVDYALRCLATGEKRILVLAGTIVSKGTVFRNPMHRAIFGDGAGGVLLEATDNPGPSQFLAGGLWTDGQYFDVITMPNLTSVHSPRIPMEYKGSFYMGRREVINEALRNNLSRCVDEVLQTAGVTKDEIDVAFIHQPSKPLFEEALKAVGVPRSKVIEDYELYGNTISAELPISLDENVRNGRIKRGDTILMVTFGAGFSAGILLFRY